MFYPVTGFLNNNLNTNVPMFSYCPDMRFGSTFVTMSAKQSMGDL